MTKDEQHTNLTPEIKQACMMLGIAVMSDIRMVVREELERFGLANSAASMNPNDVATCGNCGEDRSSKCNTCEELERDFGRPISAPRWETTPKTTCGWKTMGVDGCNTQWDEETQKWIRIKPPCNTCEAITAIYAGTLVDEDHRPGKYETEGDDHPWEWIPEEESTILTVSVPTVGWRGSIKDLMAVNNAAIKELQAKLEDSQMDEDLREELGVAFGSRWTEQLIKQSGMDRSLLGKRIFFTPNGDLDVAAIANQLGISEAVVREAYERWSVLN
jgi:hypothetical protein